MTAKHLKTNFKKISSFFKIKTGVQKCVRFSFFRIILGRLYEICVFTPMRLGEEGGASWAEVINILDDPNIEQWPNFKKLKKSSFFSNLKTGVQIFFPFCSPTIIFQKNNFQSATSILCLTPMYMWGRLGRSEGHPGRG